MRIPEPLDPGAIPTGGGSWAAQEFGTLALPDGRLRTRLIRLAEAFFAQPTATLSSALQGDAGQTKAAYRFFKNPQVTLQTLLQPHYQNTLARITAHPWVLVAQDTTSLNYAAHPATSGLGPINTRADGALGLKLHDSLALTPEGVPLGLVDIQLWARDAEAMGQARQRKQRPIEEKESLRWLTSFRRTAEFQRLCPQTRLVNIADRESDLYELFQEATRDPQGPHLLIRANRTTQRQVEIDEGIAPLWDYLPAQPLIGRQLIQIPSRGGRKARLAELALRLAPIRLQPPKRLQAEPIDLWAIHAIESCPPEEGDAVEWLLLTTVPTQTLEEASERLGWYAARWNIEVYHRTLKSGCRIEDRRLGDADSLASCLAIDLVVAWRILYLTKLGREAPDLPCSVCFEVDEWKALYCYTDKTPVPPESPPPLGDAMRRVAKLGGFLGRKGDGHPGATTLWRGLDKLYYLTEGFRIFHPSVPGGP
ncbi:IS4 family transposase [gamma proteobacterium SS-5]|uniref:IS4 family transposase n=1 Tax=Magnetovirga frankeli TaxID=947516 RepID=UPI00129363CA